MDNNILIKLREETSAGVMQCKRALEAAGGDYEKAKAIIAKEGAIKAEIKKERSMGAGVLEAYIHMNRVGVLLELRCETDFVAKGDFFKELAHDVAMHIAAMNPQDVDSLLAQPFVKNDSLTIKDLITAVVGKTGENIAVQRFVRYEL